MAARTNAPAGDNSLFVRARLMFFPDGVGSVARYIALLMVVALAIIALFPLYFALVTSFRLPEDVGTVPPKLGFSTPSVQNYAAFFRGTRARQAPRSAAGSLTVCLSPWRQPLPCPSWPRWPVMPSPASAFRGAI